MLRALLKSSSHGNVLLCGSFLSLASGAASVSSCVCESSGCIFLCGSLKEHLKGFEGTGVLFLPSQTALSRVSWT